MIPGEVFIDALCNNDLASKIREREPATLEQTVKIAIWLESYMLMAAGGTVHDNAQVKASSSEDKSAVAMNLLKSQLILTQTRLAELQRKSEEN